MTQLVVINVPHVVEPDAIFDRDGVQVWGAVKQKRTVYFDVHVDAPINPFSGTAERLIHSDPGSSWGWYQDGAGGTSFRRKDKR